MIGRYSHVTFYEFDSSSSVGYNGLTGEVPKGFQDSENFILTGMFRLKIIIYEIIL